MDLKGAMALVTGGNGGLGQRICHALAKEGAHVAIMYARSRDQAESVAGELTSRYHQGSGVRLRHHGRRGCGPAGRRSNPGLRPPRYSGQ
jgi:NAD(P)-dependent dehydrogenase (short-subunit alcohol dehydrogenase family)